MSLNNVRPVLSHQDWHHNEIRRAKLQPEPTDPAFDPADASTEGGGQGSYSPWINKTRNELCWYDDAGDMFCIIPGAAACGLGSTFLNGQYLDADTGLPVWVTTYMDNMGVIQHVYYYIDANGVTTLSNNQTVGANALPAKVQFIGNHKYEILAAADMKVSLDDMKTAMETAGALLYDPLSNSQAFVAKADMIVKIDIDLKPVEGGAGELGETDGRATSSEAAVIMPNGDYQNIDPGGSRTFGDVKNGEFYVPTNFDTLQIAAGSVVEITLLGATVPA